MNAIVDDEELHEACALLLQRKREQGHAIYISGNDRVYDRWYYFDFTREEYGCCICNQYVGTSVVKDVEPHGLKHLEEYGLVAYL